MEENSQIEPKTEQQSDLATQKSVKNRKNHKGLVIFLIILLLISVAGGIAAYFWRDSQAASQKKDLDSRIVALEKQVQKLTTTSDKTVVADEISDVVVPSTSVIENIEASITSGNTAALGGYMADSVDVICVPCGLEEPGATWQKTKDQAVAEVTSFISTATDTWDFNLSDSTLSQYANYSTSMSDFLKQDSVIIGKSSVSNHIIIFEFDSNGKIDQVITTNEEYLL